MKIQAHPGFPPMPFIFTIAAESNPEKAPDSWVELVREGKKQLTSTSQRTEDDDKNMAILK